jgi:hypothetical protein
VDQLKGIGVLRVHRRGFPWGFRAGRRPAASLRGYHCQ